jgi:alkylation response protein AidB-like acyl-CoA dehydrogenase
LALWIGGATRVKYHVRIQGEKKMISLNEEQKMMLQTVRDFMNEKVAPVSLEMDETQSFKPEIITMLADLGLLSLIVPKAYGGLEVDLTTLCLVIEEISKVDASVGVTVQCNSTGQRPILIAGSEQLKESIFSPAIQKGHLFGFAITEPEGGSDSAAIRSKAEKKGRGYLINGRKCFITNGGIADQYLVFAVTNPKGHHKGISGFIVEANTGGLSIGKKENKMGLRASPTTDLFFEDMSVPAEKMVGEENEGFNVMMRTLDGTRPTIAAQALGIAEGALSYVLNYSKERTQFGKPLIDFQGIQFMLADMATAIEAARTLTYNATTMYDNGYDSVSPFAAISKLFSSDMVMKVTTDAVQIMGGYGYMKDHPVERMMRDAKVTQIYEGTNQIQRVVIARWLNKRGYPFKIS